MFHGGRRGVVHGHGQGVRTGRGANRPDSLLAFQRFEDLLRHGIEYRGHGDRKDTRFGNDERRQPQREHIGRKPGSGNPPADVILDHVADHIAG